MFGDVLNRDVLSEIRASPFFSIMIDETTDITIHSQLSIHRHNLLLGFNGALTFITILVNMKSLGNPRKIDK